MKALIRVFAAVSLTLASVDPALAGNYAVRRAAAKTVAAPVGYAGAAVLVNPAALKLEAPRLAPVGSSLALPVAPALAVPTLSAPLSRIAAEAPAPVLQASLTQKDASPRAAAAVRTAQEKPLLQLGSKGSVNAADREAPGEDAGEGLSKTVSDQARRAGKIADAQKTRFNAGAFSAIFDGGGKYEPTPVRTDEARRAIASKIAPAQKYLAPTEGLERAALLSKLREISGRGYRSQGYKEATKELFSNVDNFEYNGKRGIMAAYSQVFVPGHSTDGSSYKGNGDVNGDGYSNREGMNTEHLWPQSYFNRRVPMRSDLHHLMATFVKPNGERSRYPFGEVPDNQAIYRNKAGAKLGNDLFEPPDAVKGRVARGMLYFYMRYGNQNILPGQQARNFWNSRLEMFLRWHEQHPPDVFERRRNDLVEKFQGNRNPFVDDPGLVRRIGIEALTIQSGRAREVAGREREAEAHQVVDARPAVGVGARSSGSRGKSKRGHRKNRRKYDR